MEFGGHLYQHKPCIGRCSIYLSSVVFFWRINYFLTPYDTYFFAHSKTQAFDHDI